jgi:hypothetical protein
VQNKVTWYLCGELEKAVGLEGVDAIAAVGKGGRDGHGCCRLGMWKEYAG